jgi:hypothetical protein
MPLISPCIPHAWLARARRPPGREEAPHGADLPPDFDGLERRILEGTPEEQAAFLNEVRERVRSGLQEAEVNIMTGSLLG